MENLNVKIIEVSNEEFYNGIAKGLDRNEIKVINGQIVLTPRLFLRSLDVFDEEIEIWSNRLNKAKSKRIKKKYQNKITNKFNLYSFNLN